MVRIVGGSIFALAGAFFIAMNWVYFALSRRSIGRVSLMPPIGGVLTTIGLGWIPWIGPWAALALVVDPGTWLLALAGAVYAWQAVTGRHRQ